jgi:3-hydroxybutyryl-CoA dehydratase
MGNEVAILKFEDLVEGLERSFLYEVKEQDINSFAELSGDFSPLHMDAAFAKSRGFEGRVVHGAYISALISRLVGMILPGRDAIVQSTQCNFHRPTYAGALLEVTGKVTRRLDSLRATQITISVRQVMEKDKIDLVSGKVQLGFTAQLDKNGKAS